MKKIMSFTAMIMLITVIFAGCSKSEKMIQFRTPADDADIAIITTNKGVMKFQFFPSEAPKAVENFLTHAKNGYYDGLTFHRIIKDFMIQGGDPAGNGSGGESIWGEGFGVEISKKLFHFKGALCMARTDMPNSQGSQFYIVQGVRITDVILNKVNNKDISAAAAAKYKEVGGYPFLDGDYTVFGQIIEGTDVLDKIASVSVKSSAGDSQASTPVEPVIIESIKVVKYKDIK